MFASWSIFELLAAFALAALMVLLTGMRITRLVDTLADRTGIGEAIAGAVLLGAATSLSGTIVSITVALDGFASMAYSNSIGGIAAQTAFLAIADLIYRKANLEHAAADLANIFQAITLMVLLTLPLLAHTLPEISVFAIHPISLAIPVLYVGSLFVTRTMSQTPMWRPVKTRDTRKDTPEDESEGTLFKSTSRIFLDFVILMLVMGISGWVIAKTAGAITTRLAISETLVGALATAVTTSLPELVTTIAAVRRRALQLAVGGIIGGNTFDTLFLTAADVSYRDGSLYHAAGVGDQFWNLIALLMTAILLGGLILRQPTGPARMGGESLALLAVYAGAITLQVAPGLF
ncbi:MAG: sodium:calcium antiporter [Sediminimonas qiaohouensis]|uniref:Sodium:calcium antiporter n=2 Tax=Sediminimonas qiaohouensis TaxID=552061 RepID=A0A7C9LC97_9RHOB|nr:sodium:calcium antiporter [Sediminimonas qiaohouensis]MTJ05857.1 sodium:calcium antiporter [Sediminimonas qiaohouensis]